jgi:small-conductance mechanosensitive channel
MQKVLLSIVLALLLALSVVGVQHIFAVSASSGTTLVADGGNPWPEMPSN